MTPSVSHQSRCVSVPTRDALLQFYREFCSALKRQDPVAMLPLIEWPLNVGFSDGNTEFQLSELGWAPRARRGDAIGVRRIARSVSLLIGS